MPDVETISRNLAVKQDAFFRAAERAGFSIAVLCAETGVPDGTLRSYRPTNGRPKPSIMPLDVFLAIAAVVPTHLSSLLVEDSGCVIARTDAQSAAWLQIGDRAASFAAKVMRFQASDGHIDHRENAELRDDIIEIVSAGHGMIAGGEG